MIKHKKIAIITPFLANGGLEKVAIVGAEELSKTYDVTLIVMDSFRIDYPYSGKMIDLRVSLMNRNIFRRLYNIILSIIKLKRLKTKQCFDLVISHGELSNLPNVFSGGKNNILVIHGNRFDKIAEEDWQSRLVNKIVKYMYTSTDIRKIVTVSNGIRKSIIKNIGITENNIITIYNPFNIERIQKLVDEPLGAWEKFSSNEILLTMGRLNMLKGQWYLLRIFRELKKSRQTLKLVILGDGEMREELIAYSRNLGFKTYTIWQEENFCDSYDVYFMGFQTNPFNIICFSKLFLLTSLLEGFGNVIVESMASGTPVFSVDCKFGPVEIIAPELKNDESISAPYYEGVGVLMPIFNQGFVDVNDRLDATEVLWVDTLEKLLDDDEKLLEYKNNGFKRAEDFDVETIMEEWIDLIDSLLDEQNNINRTVI